MGSAVSSGQAQTPQSCIKQYSVCVKRLRKIIKKKLCLFKYLKCELRYHDDGKSLKDRYFAEFRDMFYQKPKLP
ncbi:hypothetical protein ScPMuIL_009653 [Solemya velum]